MTSESVSDLQVKISLLETESEKKHSRIRELQKAVDTISTPREKFYITTAIHYTNGNPHMGHAYENVTSDVIARYHRIFGRDVYYLTGTDEHGQKIAQTAEAAGVTPMELCNKYAAIFQQLTIDLNMSNNDFIRTTSEKHKKFAQWLFQRAFENGDVYLGSYEGWYNVREEMFVTETEAKKTDYKDPTTGLPFKKMKEESYFFKMSKYQERLVQHFHDHPEFLQPEVRRQEILRRLEEPLQDLSASRTTFSHGIQLPNDPNHVMYVWFDALANYLSAIGFADGHEHAGYWPASVHIIGKDITWFHSVIWPCILMSTNLALPHRIFAHGFVNAKDGTKMSKSIGNVVDPYEMMAKYGLDSFRYFIVRASAYGQDMPFSEDDLMNIHNSELADTLGNLVHRAVNICKKYNNGKIPETKADQETVPFDIYTLLEESEVAYQEYALQNACFVVMNALRETNKYLTDKAPWHEIDQEKRLIVVRTVLEALYVIAHFLSPLMPHTAEIIFEKLGTSPILLTQLSPSYDNLTPGTEITIGNILFHKIQTEEEKKRLEEAAAAKAAPKPLKVEKQSIPIFSSLEIRVGVIRKVWEHPESEKLYCEEIDVGAEEGPLPIASGLRAFYSLEEMQDRKVLVLLNLKPAKLGGFKSHGMVLCASNEAHDKVEFIEPPVDAVPGDRVVIDTENGEPLTAAQLKKQKIWEKASIDLKTNAQGIAMYKDQVLKVKGGSCQAKTLCNVHIS